VLVKSGVHTWECQDCQGSAVYDQRRTPPSTRAETASRGTSGSIRTILRHRAMDYWKQEITLDNHRLHQMTKEMVTITDRLCIDYETR